MRKAVYGKDENTSTHLHWSRFHWKDWIADTGLRKCSAAARGLWIDLLSVMAQNNPPGIFDCVEDEVKIIARIVGEDITDIQKWIGELEKNNVFSRTSDGRIYSRRMVREAEIYAKKVMAGNISKEKSAERKMQKDGGQKTEQKINSVTTEPRNQGTNKPNNQGSVVARAGSEIKINLDELENMLRKAAGAENNPNPGLQNLSPILGLLDAGFDLRLDILPSISRQAQSSDVSKVRTWNYFVPRIREDQETRARNGAEKPVPPNPDDLPEVKAIMREPLFKALSSIHLVCMGLAGHSPNCDMGVARWAEREFFDKGKTKDDLRAYYDATKAEYVRRIREAGWADYAK